jgi:dihydroorotase
LPRNSDRITLTRREVPVPATFPFDGEELVPFRAGSTVGWSVEVA